MRISGSRAFREGFLSSEDFSLIKQKIIMYIYFRARVLVLLAKIIYRMLTLGCDKTNSMGTMVEAEPFNSN